MKCVFALFCVACAQTNIHLFLSLFISSEERVLLGNAWNVWCKATEDVMCAPAHRIGYLMASKQTYQNNLFHPISIGSCRTWQWYSGVISLCISLSQPLFTLQAQGQMLRWKVSCGFVYVFWQEVSRVRWEENFPLSECVCVCANILKE